jgi:hypothetical protein
MSISCPLTWGSSSVERRDLMVATYSLLRHRRHRHRNRLHGQTLRTASARRCRCRLFLAAAGRQSRQHHATYRINALQSALRQFFRPLAKMKPASCAKPCPRLPGQSPPTGSPIQDRPLRVGRPSSAFAPIVARFKSAPDSDRFRSLMIAGFQSAPHSPGCRFRILRGSDLSRSSSALSDTRIRAVDTKKQRGAIRYRHPYMLKASSRIAHNLAVRR